MAVRFLHLYVIAKFFLFHLCFIYIYLVDLQFYGHDHIYERHWPVYNKKIYKGSDLSHPYTDPSAPVHIITGSAGCVVAADTLNPHMPEYNAFASRDYTYMRMHIMSDSCIHLESFSQNQVMFK